MKIKQMVKAISTLLIVPAVIAAASISASAYELNKPTQQQIIDKYNEIPFSVTSETSFDSQPSLTSPYSPGKLSDSSEQEALNALNFVRYVAGLPDNVKINESYVEKTQAGSLVNAVNNQLSHTPSQPSGMSDSLYNLGYSGTSSSNIAMGMSNLPDSILMYMEDSDVYNIEKVGHRRWILNPSMQYTGFGLVGNYSAMYAFDSQSTEQFTGDYVCWPAQNMPYELYSKGTQYAFSVTLNNYDTPSIDDVKVTVKSSKLGKTWNIDSSCTDKTGVYLNVENSWYGNPKCIIFSVGQKFDADDTISVNITGIKKSGVEKPVSYSVKFFEMFNDPPFKSEYTVKVGDTLALKSLNPFMSGFGWSWTYTSGCMTWEFKSGAMYITGVKPGTINLKITYSGTGKVYNTTVNVVCNHNYQKVKTVAPTCNQKGYTLYKCSNCGEEEKRDYVDPTYSHSYGDWVIETSATCQHTGRRTKTCKICGATYSESIQKTDHTFGSWTVTKNAACTSEGEKQRKCSVCGITETQTINATGHTYSTVWTTDKAATCTTAGSKSHHCTVCGAKKDITAIPATGHKYDSGKVTKKATCTENGVKVYTCTVCKSTKSETIKATGHTYSTVWTTDKAATCTTAGSKSHHCTVCGAKKDITAIPATGHKYDSGKITKKATCTENGVKVYTCTVCKSTKSETIKATGHTYSTVWTTDKAATCTTAGSKSHHCTVCGAKKDVTAIPATGHKYDSGKITKKATCTENGVKVYTCTVCKSTKSETIKATGHTYSTVWTTDKAATCTTAGSKSHHCTVCGAKKDITAIPATGHKYKTTVVKLTCTEKGYTLHKCSVCGNSYKDTYTNELGHKFGSWSVTKKATCTSNGILTRKCSVCGKTETKTVKATGHSYSIKVKTVAPTITSQGYTLYKCSKCGATIKKNYTAKLISISKAKVTGLSTKTYTGKQIKPAIKVTYGNTVLKNGTDYTVKYGTNKIGKGTVTITGKGKYGGKVTKTFAINPRKTPVTVKSTATGKFTATVEKKIEATKYQIQYSTNSKFTGAKTLTTKSLKSDVKASSGKTYYVRVRTIKTVGKTNYVSGWSAVKKVKIK